MSDFPKTFYGVLGVMRVMDTKSIRDAYYRLAVQHHPDRGGDVDKMVLINRAWEILSSDKERKDYELRLMMRSQTCPDCQGRGGLAIHKRMVKTLRECPTCRGEGVVNVKGDIDV